ncbi:alpha-galactosidase a [Fusarium sp. NRRL 52700]|nr:alpha-galactosidase a [Fusarium sp. NRRL 52700]
MVSTNAATILDVCAYHRRDFDLVLIRSRPHENQVVRESIEKPFTTTPTAKLGALDILPNELLNIILRNLDLLSYFRFRHVNRRSRILASDLQEHKAVARHGVEGFRGMLIVARLSVRPSSGGIATVKHLRELKKTYRGKYVLNMESNYRPRIISMDFSTAGRDDCYFRILTGHNVKYVTIQAGALDAESLMDMPLNFENILPPLRLTENDWNTASVFRDTNNKLDFTTTMKSLPSIQNWHCRTISFLELERKKQLTLLAEECSWKEDQRANETSIQEPSRSTMVAKMARFPWEVAYLAAETRVYKTLESSGITPQFLGHINEGGRTIGFLLEKVQGRHAGKEDLEACQNVLSQLHDLGILHGDVNRYNFIIGSDGKAVLIDFEKAREDASVVEKDAEMRSLPQQLAEESGRGGGFIFDADEELE